MKIWIQRLVGLLVFLVNTSLLAGVSMLYRKQYESLAAFHVEGLALMILVAWVLAITAAPFFAEAMATDSQDKPKSLLEAIQLYVSVTVIAFVALSCVFFVLWILGWIMEFSKLGLTLFKRWLRGAA